MYKPTKEQAKKYYEAYREKNKNNNRHRLSRLLQQARVRAKKFEVDCDLTLDELIAIFPEDGKCPVLGLDLKWGCNGKANRWCSPSLDRVDPKGNYTKSNIRIISWRANKIKSDCTVNEIELILKYMKA